VVDVANVVVAAPPPTRGFARWPRGVVEQGPVRQRSHRRLGSVAWQIADELGWAKTYDAEYVALAKTESCRLVTLDSRLRRGTDRLGFVVTPAELA
jgi:hypothetical protein